VVKTHGIQLGPTLNSQNWRQGDGWSGYRYQYDVQMVWRLSKTIQTSLANAKMAGIPNKRLIRLKVVYRAYFDMRVRGTRWVVVEIRDVLDIKKKQMTWLKYAKGCEHLWNSLIHRFALCLIYIYMHACINRILVKHTQTHMSPCHFSMNAHIETWQVGIFHSHRHQHAYKHIQAHSHTHTHTDTTRHVHVAYAHVHTRHVV
jgi:hypothetical protein